MNQIRTSLTYSALLIVATVVSCGHRTTKTASAKTTQASAIPITTPKRDKINLDMSAGYDATRLHKDPMQTLTIGFFSPGAEKLYGRIILPDEYGNVRFNQIFMHGGTADGPFGRDMVYDLNAEGNYRLEIGESLMQGDPYEGQMTVELFSGEEVPYTPVANYFVRNDVEDENTHCIKITTKEEFEALFGAAATMTAKPETIDFPREYLIGIIGHTTDMATSFEPVIALTKGGIVTMVYHTTTGEKQSHTMRPYLLLRVSRSFDGALRVIKTD